MLLLIGSNPFETSGEPVFVETFRSVRRMTNQERFVCVGGTLLGPLALVAIVLATASRHASLTVDECRPARALHDDGVACQTVTSLMHLDAWSYWISALGQAIVIIFTIILAVMGVVYVLLGKWLQIRDGVRNRSLNYALRDDFRIIALGLAGAVGFIILATGLGIFAFTLFA